MRRQFAQVKPYLIATVLGTILVVDLSNQWEVPIAQLPNEVHDRYISELKADAPKAELLALAQADNSQAQYILALRHTIFAPADLQIKDDPVVAFTWMNKAAEKRHARAMSVVALYYARGIGVAKDETKAAEWAAKAADKGQPMGYRVLGDLAKAKAEAIKPDKKSANFNTQMALRDKHQGEAFKQYRRGADAGDRHSLRELAKAYEIGQPGMPQNYRLALEYYTRAAMRRDVKAIRILADRYESGEKTPKDLKQAYAWRLVLIELEEDPDDVGKLGITEKQMTLNEVQAGQEAAAKIIAELPTESADALARLNPGR
jgi:TPR repeat protein